MPGLFSKLSKLFQRNKDDKDKTVEPDQGLIGPEQSPEIEPVAVNETDGVSGAEQKEQELDVPAPVVKKTDQEVKYDMYLAMANAMGYSIDESDDKVNVIGLRGWKQGEAVENVRNKYNDTFVCLYHEVDPTTGVSYKRCSEFIGSVDPGKFDGGNAKGDAHLVDGQYTYKDGQHKGYDAFRCENTTVWRDKNKDAVRQDKEIEETGAFGINFHAAGDVSGNVGNWSEGCQVVASHDGTKAKDNTTFKCFKDLVHSHSSGDAGKQSFVYTLIDGQAAKEKVLESNKSLVDEFDAVIGNNKAKEGAYSAGDVNIGSAVTANKNLKYSKDKWKEVQKALGFTGSDVDGLLGTVTTGRIAFYQESHGLPITGICDDATYAMMTETKNEEPAAPKSSSTTSGKVGGDQDYWDNVDAKGGQSLGA